MDNISPFGEFLRSCTYVVALVGAGLSASSGVPTFTDSGAYWRGYPSKSLATRSAFSQDLALANQFYEHRRNIALAAQPNAGHYALARLAERTQHFFPITQNIDDLSQRAGHPAAKLSSLHGSLFTSKCFNDACPYSEVNSQSSSLPTYPMAGQTIYAPDSETRVPRTCPRCMSSFLRPGVVLFGEKLPEHAVQQADRWLEEVPRVDVLLLIGTSARVFPAAEYIWKAREKGACVAQFNIERDDDLMCAGDWFIPGDAAQTLPSVVAEYFGDTTYTSVH